MNERTITGAAGVPATEGRTGKSTRRPAWLLPTGLITLGMIPILANALRRVALSVAAAPSADAAPALSLPVFVHVIAATVFVILGALQFSAGLRRRRRSWHRVSGRVVIAAGSLAALSGLWLAVYSSVQSGPLPSGPGLLLLAFRLLAGSAMLLCIVLGFLAIVRRHDVPLHRAWMIRAYALALGAATQVFTLGFGELLFGAGHLSVALLNGAGWAINLAVAELVIRRPGRRPRPLVVTVPVPS
jgi:Predicted membrane protein (DUF2306)